MVRKGKSDAEMKGTEKKVNAGYIVLKILMWLLIFFFAADALMQFISYSFYKGDRAMKDIAYEPQKIQINETLTGYGYDLDADSDKVVLFFGGSKYIAYNTVGMFGGLFDCPVLSVDYYGTQDSKGKMNLKTMQRSAEELYDHAAARYPGRKICVIGHSYGCGMAAYLAGARDCSHLVLASGYRTSADMYNKIIPVFRGAFTVFIKNNIRADKYAESTACPVTVIGSDADTTLDADLQRKLADCYKDAECKIFNGISHEGYFAADEVIRYVNDRIL